MISGKDLLNDLKPVLRKLEDDMRGRCDEFEAIDSGLKAEYQAAVKAERTAETYTVWRDELITQSAVAWILACVFVRFMEDNDLVDNVSISGPGPRLSQARDRHTLYFREHPKESDREYLTHTFREVSNLPAVKELFGIQHNPLWRLGPTGDGAAMLLGFFQKIDPDTGRLIHDFTDEDWDTRFLGDLYQDLSEPARKKYALLQTPDFVESFILDRTLKPAIDTFGLAEVRLIDPSCGSGHFLLGTFHRLLKIWQERAPEINERELAARALNAIYGVDLNPYAVAIARFRLLIAALKASGIRKMKNAPDFKIHLAVGDSLLHGRRPGGYRKETSYLEGFHPIGHVYESEDAEKLREILGKQYHVVVGNPPYITVKDRALNKIYRDRFGSCFQKFSLSVPFFERFFDLATDSDPPGFVGMITSNSFMKRTFGQNLIEHYIPKWDITHLIDTSGVPIPGHGTPTLIIFGRNRAPVNTSIRTVMGIKGEPQLKGSDGGGKAWKAILKQIEWVGSESEYVSVADSPRENFHKHPWSLTGGGADSLLELLEGSDAKLADVCVSIGITSFTLEDDIYICDKVFAKRNGIENKFVKSMILGDSVRDWAIQDTTACLFPYNSGFLVVNENYKNRLFRILWQGRTTLANNKMFGGKTKVECGLNWYEYGRLNVKKLVIPDSICFAFVVTHNHFVYDVSGSISNRSTPVIKLKSDSKQNQHLDLVALLNSSAALFWARQTLFSKRGDPVGRWGEFIEWDGTKLKQFPIAEKKPLELAKRLDALGKDIGGFLPSALIKRHTPTREAIAEAEIRHTQIRRQMIALQEELDWQCYNFYKITDQKLWMPDPNDVPLVNLGERAFEIVMARKMAKGELETVWFERHGSTPVTEIPCHWPDAYLTLVERRIHLMETNRNIQLIEQPEYKRRWAMEPWDKQVSAALEQWLLNRLECALSGRDLMREEEAPQPATKEPRLISCAQLADQLRADKEFLQVAEIYKGRADFGIVNLVEDLVSKESVPFLPALRYKPSGLRKRKDWEYTWEMQRKEDAIDQRTKLSKDHPDYLAVQDAERVKNEQIGPIPVPLKYQANDFAKSSYWKLRGKLDVPKERFVSYLGCERDTDQTLVITWAGWDHLQQAKALAAYVEEAKNSGWEADRILPMLAGLQELVPWLRQWHNEKDPAYGIGMGDFFADYVVEEARLLGKTVEDLKAS